MKNISDFIAKSDGTLLINHSKYVNLFAMKIAKKVLKNTGVSDGLFKTLHIASLLHDIGKLTSTFQEILRGKEGKTNNKFRHNEVGWAFLMTYLNVDASTRKYVADLAYWHHGISNEMGKNTVGEILEDIDEADIENMKLFVGEVLGEDYINDDETNNNKRTPIYYSNEDEELNENSIILRTCLISADRMVSNHPSEVLANLDIDEEIDFEIKKNGSFYFKQSPYDDVVRFNRQREIVGCCDKTTVIKAPAGFGKTLTGLIWGSNEFSNKKVLWVCSRNMIAQSVYYSILEELKNSNNLENTSVELFLSGELQKSTNASGIGFDSDIIVTNIDNFLSATVHNNKADKLFLINATDVVFDEYHELISDDALFSGFLHIMRVRNRMTNSRTLLLSATPTHVNRFWDSVLEQTTILPSPEKHYPAAHTKKFTVKTLELETPSEITKHLKESQLIKFNSINTAQSFARTKKDSFLIHSEYEKQKRGELFELLMKTYGKKSGRETNKPTTVSTPILQASLDVSFTNVFESVLSPETTIQVIGRLDRWGDQKYHPTLFTIKFKNSRSENFLKTILYDKDLSDLWFQHISKYNNQELCLDELYEIYNSFWNKNKDLLKKYLNKRNRKSLESFSKIYPIMFQNTTKQTDVMTAGANKLRSTNNEVFYIMKKNNGDGWTEPFSKKIFDSFGSDFNERGDILGRIVKAMKMIDRSDDDRYDYSEILKHKDRINIDAVRKYAKKSNTPYICFNKVYDEKYGVQDVKDDSI